MPRRERKVTVSGPVASVAKSARTLGNPRSHAGALKKRPTGEPVGLVYWWSWRELKEPLQGASMLELPPEWLALFPHLFPHAQFAGI
jgi:hypothetical protein